MTVAHLGRTVLRVVVSLALLLAVGWAAAALWIDGPESRVLAGTLALGLVPLAVLACD